MKNLGFCSCTHLLGSTANPASTYGCLFEFTYNATSNTRMNPLGSLDIGVGQIQHKEKGSYHRSREEVLRFFLFFGNCKRLWHSLRCTTVLQYHCCTLLFFPGLSEVIIVQADLALSAGIQFLSSSAVVCIGQILNNSQIQWDQSPSTGTQRQVRGHTQACWVLEGAGAALLRCCAQHS